MNGAVLLIGSFAYFLIGYFLYGGMLKRRFGVDNSQKTPAVTLRDDVDFCPTNPMVLFGHHFASIAGAGPIVGPVLAALLGWLPALLWILIGCVFIGAMHDFAALFLSIRNQGRSIAFVIQKEIGYWGRQLFLFFCLAALVLVVTVFTTMVADGFLANPAVASSSIAFILMAPIFGIITNRRVLGLLEGSLVFVPLLFFFVWFGTVIPFDLTQYTGSAATARTIWIWVLLYYAFIASTLPVWILLQPRDYLNSYLLYVMMLLGIVAIVGVHPSIQLAPIDLSKVSAVPNLFPLLFVTIACGACSGFHALVASGTTSKQIAKENHSLPIAYGGMLLEGLLAVIALISVAYLGTDQLRSLLTGPEKVPAQIAFAKGLAHFAAGIGISETLAFNFFSLAISAFILTSLDTATRLARFVWQELVLPQKETPVQEKAPVAQTVLSNRWTATIIIIALSALLCFSGAGAQVWPVFGAANQLLAALTLLCVTLWLIRKKYPYLFALLPCFFMMIISIWALVCLIMQNAGKSIALVSISVLLLLLALILVILGIKHLCTKRS